MNKFLLSVSLVFLLGALFGAEPGESVEDVEDLAQKAYVLDGSTVEMHEQIGAAVAELEAERNRLAEKLRGFLDAEELDKFQIEQAAWQGYLQAQVTLHSFEYRGGTISGIVYGRRRIELLQERLLTLRTLIDIYAPH